MRLLVTGFSGFIGSHFFKKCLNEYKNIGLSHLCGTDINKNSFVSIKDFISKNDFSCDYSLCNDDFSSDIILSKIRNKEFDAIMHFAALPRVAFSVKNPFATDSGNINKSVRMLEECIKSNTPIVFASSSSVYGGLGKMPTSTEEPMRPISPYALQKATFEQYLNIYHSINNFKSISLRFFNVYGPGQDGSSSYSTVIASWMHKIKNNMPLVLEGDGEQKRDFCFVDDVVSACFLAIKKIETVHGSFNVACGKNYSCNDILKYLQEKYCRSNLEVVRVPPRKGDVRETLADISKSTSILGYMPRFDLYKGIDITMDWWKDKN